MTVIIPFLYPSGTTNQIASFFTIITIQRNPSGFLLQYKVILHKPVNVFTKCHNIQMFLAHFLFFLVYFSLFRLFTWHYCVPLFKLRSINVHFLKIKQQQEFSTSSHPSNQLLSAYTSTSRGPISLSPFCPESPTILISISHKGPTEACEINQGGHRARFGAN